ncbi:MAG TPA: MvaI/BcnI family restriction endonuclease [Kiritimatiellia bacterium]|nr:MvaI/BcnI family restriction endonuclease [Kiritimatiellia bacterium]
MMNMRPLTAKESQNLAVLNAAGIESVPLFLTATGYRKAICDATDPMRAFLLKHSIHDYSTQRQGPDNKVIRQVHFLAENGLRFMDMAFYRPVTKKGDPRFWVYGWKAFVDADNVLAFFFDNGSLCIANLSTVNLAAPAINTWLTRRIQQSERISKELLSRLCELARRPLPATCSGDTAIGRAVEAALGIPINSSGNPDYKGIELKAKRERTSAKRNGLFTCVPDWTLSHIKDFKTFLDRFGYQRGDDFKLYCTVSTKAPNPQGLLLSLGDAGRFLWENVRKNGSDERLMVWPLSKLEDRLTTKHKETFWIKADSVRDNSGREFFYLKSVTHTRNPNVPQFSRLLSDGSITLDHLIKRTPSGGVKEKGPQFKLAPDKFSELFLGEPKRYRLAE